MITLRCRTLLLIALGMALPGLAEQRLLSVAGRRLSIDCEGTRSGAATVVLLAGGGRTAKDWGKVQPAVARSARVCSYDRAGLGESGKTAKVQTVDEIVDDLRELLKAAGEKPPYVLAGHSIAGIYCRRFATRFPDDVAALVFVDSSHEEQYPRLREIAPNLPPRPAETGDAFFDTPGQKLRWETKVPVIVLAHGKSDGRRSSMSKEQLAAFERLWRELQRDLAKRSPKGQLRVAERSGHYIHTDQPEMVIEAIRESLTGGGR